MVKFEFELSDVDAENLFGCIEEEITQCRLKILKNIKYGEEDPVVLWYNNRIEYLSFLKTKLYNTKV